MMNACFKEFFQFFYFGLKKLLLIFVPLKLFYYWINEKNFFFLKIEIDLEMTNTYFKVFQFFYFGLKKFSFHEKLNN